MVVAWWDDLAEWLASFVGLLGDRRRAQMTHEQNCIVQDAQV